MGQSWLNSITVRVHEGYDSETAEKQLLRLLELRHGKKDVFTWNMDSVLKTAERTTHTLQLFLTLVAVIALVVGGIGVMNIMLVSVTERTREIGLRMSIGAKGRHILFQFLIEAVIISVTGGIIGVFLGIGSSLLITYAIGWPIYLQMYSVVLSFLVCTITGIFFGWYPAQKASQLNPIDAIRYE